MKKYKWFWLAPIIIAAAAGIIFLLLLALKFCWGWVVPDLFPGAVAQGLIAGELSWFTTFKLSLILVIIGGLLGSCSGSECKCRDHKEDPSD